MDLIAVAPGSLPLGTQKGLVEDALHTRFQLKTGTRNHMQPIIRIKPKGQSADRDDDFGHRAL